MKNNVTERVEDIGGGVKILTSSKFNYTLDSILLANFSSPSANCRALDLGSGCGIIPLIWCGDGKAKDVTAIEIREEACDMLRRSRDINGFEERINVINADLRDFLTSGTKLGPFDAIACNPPYFALGSGKRPKSKERSSIRYEIECSLDDVISFAERFLKNGGDLFLCHRTSRLCDVMCSMRKRRVEPKTLRFVKYREGTAPKLFLIKGKKNAKPGLSDVSDLTIMDENGSYTREASIIYYGESI